MKQEIAYLTGKSQHMRGMMPRIRQLAREIELLSPAVKRDGQREDNCEYPWEAGGKVLSPLMSPAKVMRIFAMMSDYENLWKPT
jgi:hypothetical protein